MNLYTSQKLLNAGYPEKAKAALADQGSDPDPRNDLWLARIDMETGDLDSAIDCLEQLSSRFTDYAPAVLFQGIAHWDLTAYECAKGCFQRVLALQPQNGLAKSYVALCELALGNPTASAQIWRDSGLSDNVPFRIRVIEYLESCWIETREFMGQSTTLSPIEPLKVSKGKALKLFYKRDFAGMLRYVPPPPADGDLMSFLAATGHEMLRDYASARSYLDAMENQRDQWPDPLVALNARLLTREGKMAEAAREFSKVLIVGPEDFGVNYYLGVICLAYEKRTEARQYFSRALGQYMVDTQEFQWWQIQRILLHSE